MAKYNNTPRRLLREVVCPHCWRSFKPEETLWISVDPAQLGDERLGDAEPGRFLPSEFDVDGVALDSRRNRCHEIACPSCHLKLPASALDSPTHFMSIVGAPGSGKSYYLAASTWTMRRDAPLKFRALFTDADPVMNARIHEYEDSQFVNANGGYVKIEKTQEQGDQYDVVYIDEQNVLYPNPYVFLLSPSKGHPLEGDYEQGYARTICLYDNAGESYLPSNDQAANPVTRHLAKSSCIFFLYDPIQDGRMSAAIQKVEPGRALTLPPNAGVRQEVVFTEMTRRARNLRQMRTNDRFEKPFVVVVSKADEWACLEETLTARDRDLAGIRPDSLASIVSHPLGRLLAKSPFARQNGYYYLRGDLIKEASDITRAILLKYVPEFVVAVDNFATNPIYVPVSATGVPPTPAGFRVEDMKPTWADAPLLYAIQRLEPKLIRIGSPAATTARELLEEVEPIRFVAGVNANRRADEEDANDETLDEIPEPPSQICGGFSSGVDLEKH